MTGKFNIVYTSYFEILFVPKRQSPLGQFMLAPCCVR